MHAQAVLLVELHGAYTAAVKACLALQNRDADMSEREQERDDAEEAVSRAMRKLEGRFVTKPFAAGDFTGQLTNSRIWDDTVRFKVVFSDGDAGHMDMDELVQLLRPPSS